MAGIFYPRVGGYEYTSTLIPAILGGYRILLNNIPVGRKFISYSSGTQVSGTRCHLESNQTHAPSGLNIYIHNTPYHRLGVAPTPIENKYSYFSPLKLLLKVRSRSTRRSWRSTIEWVDYNLYSTTNKYSYFSPSELLLEVRSRRMRSWRSTIKWVDYNLYSKHTTWEYKLPCIVVGIVLVLDELF